jgi:penicillin-binding protein 1A
LAQQVGREKVVQAARDLGVTSELEPGPTIALGTSSMSLMELTSAFAGVANGRYPVKPSGLPEPDEGGTPFEGHVRDNMLQLLGAVTDHGTGRAAKLPFPTFGKTGTTQSNRDAYFIGFAGDLVTGVWIGRDDNQPVGNVQGGGIPAVIWRNFMSDAVKAAPAAAAVVPEASVARGETLAPAPYGTVQPRQDFYVGEYDVEDSGGEVIPPRSEGAAVPQGLADEEEEDEVEDEALDGRPVEITAPPAPDASRLPRDDAPPRRRCEPPTLSAPPPPPEPDDDEPQEEEEVLA